MYVILALDTRPHPDIVCPVQITSHLQGTLGTFGQHLKLMLTRPIHHREATLYEFARNIFMKQIAHRIHKNDSRRLPVKGPLDEVILQSHFEAICVPRLPHCFEAFRHSFGIAILTAWTNFLAPRHRVPSGFCPFD